MITSIAKVLMLCDNCGTVVQYLDRKESGCLRQAEEDGWVTYQKMQFCASCNRDFWGEKKTDEGTDVSQAVDGCGQAEAN